MLLYVIPFVLLLVVAIVLKKREDANKENNSTSAKKANNKKTAKKNVARTARTTQRPQTQVVEDPVITKNEPKPLSAELKQSIEKLIQEKNYFSAEAKINQALNQDNSQHELYLYLLDVHLAQNDEFAVNQLINHIRSLNLDEIIEQAEARQKVAEADRPIESIAYVPTTPATKDTENTTAFDALIETDSVSEITQPEPTENKIESLEFSAPTITAPATEKSPEPIQPLEFTLNPTTQEPAETATTAPAFEATQPVEVVEAETVVPLEFSFTPNQVEPSIEKPTEIAPEFKLDFAEPTLTPVVEESVLEELKPSHEAEFKLTPSKTETQPSFSFDLEQKTETIEQEVPVAPTFNLDTSGPATVAISAEVNDPLVKSFPELAEVNEIQLNLDLAQQYIHLGAYASARELLTQDETAYTPQQRQQSQTLLNQIAS
ncbi:hypothetical protein [Acinetobacter sp. WCHAc060025]|uniref:hypothetical protein n=1 Tax=Acinetobacter sp. WCHAc060025 TaxID=2518625 RepID=UPI0010236378|nr:hypothetical protein [Acinetobacter sp. WCHAc060025]RZG78046.1 hypothetical protein EXE09_00305 [Acinetobacter sp. WCHAc060025]